MYASAISIARGDGPTPGLTCCGCWKLSRWSVNRLQTEKTHRDSLVPFTAPLHARVSVLASKDQIVSYPLCFSSLSLARSQSDNVKCEGVNFKYEQ